MSKLSLKSVFSPAQEAEAMTRFKTVLQNYVLPYSENGLQQIVISRANVQGRILQLTINTFPAKRPFTSRSGDELR